jgi:hypothetical protein
LSAGNALPGTYNWMAVFYDGANNAICRTNFYWLDVRANGSSDPAPDSGGGASIVQNACGFFVVVLDGSPFAGAANLNVAGDNYDGSGQALNDNCGLAIHGNNNANTLTGGAGNDQIFGYAGDDILNGGDESCSGDLCNSGGTLGDTLNGGDGGPDTDTIDGGTETNLSGVGGTTVGDTCTTGEAVSNCP